MRSAGRLLIGSLTNMELSTYQMLGTSESSTWTALDKMDLPLPAHGHSLERNCWGVMCWVIQEGCIVRGRIWLQRIARVKNNHAIL